MAGVIDLRNPLNRSHPLARGLVAFWTCLPGWMGGAKWYDLCGLNSATLTNMNSSASGWRGTTRLGGYGHLAFDGVDDYAVTGTSLPPPALRNLSGMSVAFWFVILGDCWGGFGNFYGDILDTTSGNGNNGWSAYMQSVGQTQQYFVKLYRGCSGADATANSAQNISKNIWHHFCGTYSAASKIARVYLDRVDVTASATTGVGSEKADDAALYIGKQPANPSFFNGALDDVRVYNRTLSSAEVKSLYDNSRLGCPGLLSRVDCRLPAGAGGLVTTRKVGLGGLSGLGGVSGVF